MKQELLPYKKILEERLHSFLDLNKQYFNKWEIENLSLFDYIKTFITSGKLLRGSIVLHNQPLKNIPESYITTAMALEMFHSALLIHDDIMDDDDMRRSMPSAHAFIQKQLRNTSKHVAQSIAICIADVLFFFAYNLIHSIDHKNQNIIATTISNEMIQVGMAQTWDIYWSEINYDNTMLSRERIMQLYEYKTARYTFSLPFTLNAILNNESKQYQKLLFDIGTDIGIIFQITDDLLEIKQQTTHIGKSSFSDIVSNKKTLPFYLLIERVSKEDQKLITNLLGTTINKKDHAHIVSMIEKYEVFNELDAIIQEYASKALSKTTSLPETSSFKVLIPKIIEFLLTRSL